jgi:hypothetical protein
MSDPVKHSSVDPWTGRLLAQLYDNVFARRMECPACGGRLAVVAGRDIGVAGTAACHACGAEHLVQLSTDPRRETFRPFTEAEAKAIRRADGRRQTPICPIDGTAMDVHAQRSLGLTSNTRIRCPRCLGTVAYVRTCG